MKTSEMIEKPADDSALAIRSNIAQVESALSEFDKISTGISALNEQFPPDLVYDVATTKGMAEAVAHRAAWRDPRIKVEKLRKTAKAPVLALGKDIDARASWITEQLLLGETPVHEQIKAEESRKEAEKQAKINAEFGRVQGIQEAIADIHMTASVVSRRPAAEIAAKVEQMKSEELSAAVFQENLLQAKEAQLSAIAKLEQAYRAALHNEAEAAKLVSERLELEQLRKAAAEQKAKDEAAALAAAALERERLAAERKTAQEAQTKLDSEAAAQRAEADRLAAEARRQAQEAHDAEMQKQRAELAEQARLAEEKAKKESAAKRKAEAADKKLRDAAPRLLAALKAAIPLLPTGEVRDEASAAANAAA